MRVSAEHTGSWVQLFPFTLSTYVILVKAHCSGPRVFIWTLTKTNLPTVVLKSLQLQLLLSPCGFPLVTGTLKLESTREQSPCVLEGVERLYRGVNGLRRAARGTEPEGGYQQAAHVFRTPLPVTPLRHSYLLLLPTQHKSVRPLT